MSRPTPTPWQLLTQPFDHTTFLLSIALQNINIEIVVTDMYGGCNVVFGGCCILINAWHMRTRVTVLSLCVCVCVCVSAVYKLL